MLAAALLATLPFEQTAKAQGNWPDLAQSAPSERPRQQQRRSREPAPPAAKQPEKAPEPEPAKQPEKQVEKPPEKPAAPVVYQPNCEQPRDSGDAAVCEQRRLIKALEDSVALAASQLWLGVFGVASILGALALSGWAAMAASRAAGAARDQARLSRESLVGSERAFVYVQDFQADPVHDPAEDNKLLGWNVFVEWRNSGKTATRSCVQRANYKEFIRPVSADFDFPNLEVIEYQWLLIGPNAAVQSRKYFIAIDKLPKIRSGDLHAYFWGWIEYNDVFPNTPRHRTEYGYKIIASAGAAPDQIVISAAPTPRHNAADRECFHKVISTPQAAA